MNMHSHVIDNRNSLSRQIRQRISYQIKSLPKASDLEVVRLCKNEDPTLRQAAQEEREQRIFLANRQKALLTEAKARITLFYNSLEGGVLHSLAHRENALRFKRDQLKQRGLVK